MLTDAIIREHKKAEEKQIEKGVMSMIKAILCRAPVDWRQNGLYHKPPTHSRKAVIL